MNFNGPVCTVLMVALVTAACSDDAASPTATQLSAASSSAQQQLGHSHSVSLMDACDPTTFNEALGPGACVRNGGVTLENFTAQLTKHGKVGSWHFAPGNVHAKVGNFLEAVNRGGEVHTFTEVAAFGGGFVPQLNALSGNPVPAPECLDFGSIVFIAAGNRVSEELDAAGTERYQCCIHPWMRSVVTVR